MLDLVLSLILGVAVSVIVGRVLQRAGRPFLDDVFQDDRVASSVAQLLTVFFYLVSLGAALLISTYSISAEVGWLYATAIKTGAVLLVVGALHGVTLAALLMIKRRRRQALAQEAIAAQRGQRPRR